MDILVSENRRFLKEKETVLVKNESLSKDK